MKPISGLLKWRAQRLRRMECAPPRVMFKHEISDADLERLKGARLGAYLIQEHQPPQFTPMHVPAWRNVIRRVH